MANLTENEKRRPWQSLAELALRMLRLDERLFEPKLRHAEF